MTLHLLPPSRPQPVSISGVSGVSWCRDTKRWRARIKIAGQRHALGSFRLFEDAVAARRAAEAQRDAATARAALAKASNLFAAPAPTALPLPVAGHTLDRLVDEVILRLIADGYVRCPEC